MPPSRRTTDLSAGLLAVAAILGAAVPAATAAEGGARLAGVSFEGASQQFAGRDAAIRTVGIPSAPDGDRVAHVAARGPRASYAIRAARNLHLPRRPGRFVVSAYVRAASASSVGKPVALRVRQWGGGPTRVTVVRSRLTSRFAKLTARIVTKGPGRRIDIRISAGGRPGNAFLADAVTVARMPRGSGRPGAAPPRSTPANPQPSPSPATSPGAASPIGGLTSFRGDWETGNTSQWSINCVASDRLRIVTDPVRQGRYAARFEVREGDKPSSAGERCEVHRSTRGDESAGQAYYYAWSTMVPVGWVNPKNYGMFVQFHTTWPYPPTLEITTQFGEFYLLTRGGDRDDYDGRRTTIVPTLSPGKWNDFAMYVKWGVRDGAVKIWHRVQGGRDFKVVFDQTDVPTVMTSGGVASKLLLRHGYYRGSGSPGTAVVYQDGMRRGATLADVMADFPAS